MSDARNTSAPRAAVLRVLASASSAPPPTHIPTLKSCVRTLDSDTAPVPRARSGYLEAAVGLGHRLGLARVEVKAVHVEAWREGTSTSQGRRGRGRTTRVRRRERARSRGGGGEVAKRDCGHQRFLRTTFNKCFRQRNTPLLGSSRANTTQENTDGCLTKRKGGATRMYYKSN